MTRLETMAKEQYAEELAALGPKAFKKSDLESLKSGFADGLRAMRVHLTGMGVFAVAETDQEAIEATS